MTVLKNINQYFYALHSAHVRLISLYAIVFTLYTMQLSEIFFFCNFIFTHNGKQFFIASLTDLRI